jgi:hypothetical protein
MIAVRSALPLRNLKTGDMPTELHDSQTQWRSFAISQCAARGSFYSSNVMELERQSESEIAK